jgi:hypothetical protein
VWIERGSEDAHADDVVDVVGDELDTVGFNLLLSVPQHSRRNGGEWRHVLRLPREFPCEQEAGGVGLSVVHARLHRVGCVAEVVVGGVNVLAVEILRPVLHFPEELGGDVRRYERRG